jgi:D-alanyl-lipoteichoic acid acyltransferase DltB (MBOAT superfamily)
MVFNSLTFLVFFAIVLFLHQLPLPWTVKKFNLLIASYVFYAAWNPPFVLLLVLSAVVDYYLARWMGRIDRLGGRRLLLAISLAVNLGLLGYFKYGRFLLDQFVWLLNRWGVHFQPAMPNIILPLGISFYTFETISYLMDVYRRRIKPWNSFLDYALFLTFFPHLVAGPIVRAGDFLPQCTTPRKATSAQMGWGLSLLVLGLFEKVILADAILAPVADKVYQKPMEAGFADAWLGTLAFSGQIFFDFAGYSTCAIGTALSLGFALKDNFRFPYGAVGFTDFWQRWHVSLSTWLRDYLYIPLGGNRRGQLRTYANLMTTMLLGGLWHGASWRFVAWGGLHGMYLAVERFLKWLMGDRARPSHWLLQIPLALATFALVCVTWVFFRAESFRHAFALLATMLDPTKLLTWLSRYGQARSLALVSGEDSAWVLSVVALLVVCHWLMRHSTLEDVVARVPWWLRALGLAFLLICLALAPGDDRAFIYFQF